jgi:hypothetical protein
MFNRSHKSIYLKMRLFDVYAFKFIYENTSWCLFLFASNMCAFQNIYLLFYKEHTSNANHSLFQT